jgi:integrase
VSYLTAVCRACDRAFPPPPPLAQQSGESRLTWWARLTNEQKEAVKAWQRDHRWFPYQLRHTHGTAVRKRFGLEAAQVALGHQHAATSELYAERDESLAAMVASAIG